MKIALLFAGQGAQQPGMMRELYEHYPEVRAIYDTASEALGRNIARLSFESGRDELALTRNTQPAVLAADLAAYAALRTYGIEADLAAGFSLGEYAALVAAGVIGLADAFRLVQVRADAMQRAVAPGEGAMAALIGITARRAEQLCTEAGDVSCANYNSPVQTVISGRAAAVDRALELADSYGIRGVKLEVSAPFHSHYMSPAAEELRLALNLVQLHDASMPVYMNVTARPLEEAGDVPDLLYRQAMSPIYWQQTIEHMWQDGADVFIECGPGKTLTALLKQTLEGVSGQRVSDARTLAKTVEMVTGC